MFVLNGTHFPLVCRTSDVLRGGLMGMPSKVSALAQAEKNRMRGEEGKKSKRVVRSS